MLNNWWNCYLLFCSITAIFCLYKLYIPCWKEIKVENDKAAKRIQKSPVITGVVFSVAAFVLAPIFLIISFNETYSKKFIKGFVKGNLGR